MIRSHRNKIIAMSMKRKMQCVEVPSQDELDPFVDFDPRPREVGDSFLSHGHRCLNRPAICRD